MGAPSDKDKGPLYRDILAIPTVASFLGFVGTLIAGGFVFALLSFCVFLVLCGVTAFLDKRSGYVPPPPPPRICRHRGPHHDHPDGDLRNWPTPGRPTP